ncbi:tetratricopeptide repeat protein [Streptomyces sp. NBC_00828]|uniref:hypothetical protein n=1 Tax=Streptomyces sp. NBC_00828 TaxID=2903678 RepID=UPI003864B6E5
MSTWPRWSMEGEPAALAKYVLPDDVAALVHLPGPPASSRIAQVRAVYEALAAAGITYSHEAPSDEPDRQVIRDPGEVLWSPKHATCLDLALILAGACLHAGLHPLILILDPPETGRAAHALLGVWVGDPPPDGPQIPDTDVWSAPPEDWLDLVQQDPGGRPRPLLLLDPVGLAHPLPTSPILGARATFPEAVRTGADYAAGWDWRLAVDIGRAWRTQDTHAPANRPKDKPLRSPYVELDPDVHRPLEVLKAEHAVVPFQARDELTVLTHFCHTIAAGPHTGIALIHGVGGAGKTRLALELAERMTTREGWYTGYLRESSDGDDWLGAVASPTLIVLDYAEARSTDAERLLTVLKRRTERGATPAVIVMTARSADGQWLTDLRKTWQRDGHLCRELAPLELPPEHPDGSAVFRRAVEAFLKEPGSVDLSAVERATPVEWTTLDYILLAYLASRGAGKLPTRREDLYEEVLDHERSYWAQTYREVTGRRTEKAPLDVLTRAVACLTLRAPITRTQTLNALRAVEELADDAQWRERIRTTLTACLQPGPGEALVLRPDPIADHLTLHELDADPDLLNRALGSLDPEPLLGAMRQLNRAAGANPDTATDMIAAWIGREPDRWWPALLIAAEQRGTVLTALHQLVDANPAPPWVDDLSQAIPYTTLGLPDLGLHADNRRLTALRATASPAPADLAELLQYLSFRHSNTGDHQGALTSITQAVDIQRTLTQGPNGPAHLPNLAGSLNNLANCQSDTGDHQGALTSITEAVDIQRTLTQGPNGPAHLPNLAIFLNNLANRQSDTGDHQGALTSITQADGILRALTEGPNGPAHLSDLAGSLNNLANRQSDTGDHQGALTSITQAVDIQRTLTQGPNGPAHLPNLAMSLKTLASCQSDTGDHQGALTSITRAVTHYRTLTQANPAAYLPDLAMSLNNLSSCQSDTGDYHGALTSITETVDIQRTLTQGPNGPAHLPNLAMFLNNLANRQSDTGDHQGALTSITQADGILRALTEGPNGPAHLSDLAGSLNNLAVQQSNIGDHDAALTSITEAVDIRRILAQTNPAAHLSDLAASLNNLANQQSNAGDHQGALTSITQAVTHYHTLTQTNAAAHLPNLAASLNNLANQQSNAGDHQGALTSIAQAVTHYRTLTQGPNAAAHLPNLAMSLNTLASCQSDTGDYHGALTSITEAVDIQRTLTQGPNGPAHLPNLAMSLSNLANRQSDTGDHQGALTSITQAVTHYRTLTQTNAAAHLPNLAMSLNTLSNHQSNIGDHDAALTSITEAVDIRRILAQTNPAAHLSDLAASLNNLANQQGYTGDHQGALTSITQAVTHYHTLTQTNAAAHLPNLAASLNNLANHQSNAGDHQGALTSITQAVTHYRTLTQGPNAAAHLPNLAGSLNTLANQQGYTRNHEEALASITEAIDHYRTLAQGPNGPAHLPNLAMSLNNLANHQSSPNMTSATWEDSIAALEAHPLAQAELRAHYAEFLAERVDTDRALDQLIHATHAATADNPQLLRRVRRQIRKTAISHGINDPRLPDWATHHLPDESLELLGQWAQAANWPNAETFLRAHAERLQQPAFRHHLHLAAALFLGDQAIDRLDVLLAEGDSHGFDTVLEKGRRGHDQWLLLQTWINTPTWPDSEDFLDEHYNALHAPEIRALLAETDAPVTRQHLAILQLADQLPHDQVYEIVTDPDTATEYAFRSIDEVDIPRLRQILYAHASQMAGAPVALFATVISLADGDADQARQLAEQIAQHAADAQRRAYAIHLRTLAQHNSELAPAEALANLIEPNSDS